MEEATGAPSSFAVCHRSGAGFQSRRGLRHDADPRHLLNMLLSRHTRRREFIAAIGGATSLWPLGGGRATNDQAGEGRLLVLFHAGRGPTLLGCLPSGFARPRICGRPEHLARTAVGEWPSRTVAEARRRTGEPGVHIVVAAATPASLAAKAGAGTTPIVMVAVADPIKVGLIASFNRPGGNITGLSLLTPELSPKRLQLVLELLGAHHASQPSAIPPTPVIPCSSKKRWLPPNKSVWQSSTSTHAIPKRSNARFSRPL